MKCIKVIFWCNLFQINDASGAYCKLDNGIALSMGNKTFVIRGTESAIHMAKDLMAALLGNDQGNCPVID